MKEKEAIERCKTMIKDNNATIKEARKNGDNNTIQLTASLDSDSIAIETILNLLEKKDRKIKQLENIAEGKECVIETQLNNEKVLSNILKKKDKIIDLMSNEIYIEHNPHFATAEEAKRYFEKKVEEEVCQEKKE